MQRTVSAFSDTGEHVVDPFLGAGTVAVACWRTGRSFTGGDVNINAIRFAAARLLAEHAWPEDQQPALFAAETLGRPDTTAAAHRGPVTFLPLTSASLLDSRPRCSQRACRLRRQRCPAEPEPGATVTGKPGPRASGGRDRLVVLCSARQTARTTEQRQ